MRLLPLPLCLLALLLSGTSAHAAAPLELGFADHVFSSADPNERGLWLGRAAGRGAGIVRLSVAWSSVAPVRPNAPTDPADAAYRWGTTDDAVRAATERGLKVLVTISRAPSWAEGPGRPRAAPAGTWRPDAQAFGRFAQAAARRYSGSFRPPGETSPLPRVARWQPWNEPNLSVFLNPQWRRSGSRIVAASPHHYRALLNAFTAGVKGVNDTNTVITAGTAPFGDPEPGGDRIMPVRFVRELLCLSIRLKRKRCSGTPARFDALSHHPYGVGSPGRSALNADDASIPNIRRLVRVLRFAERRGTAVGRDRHSMWVTEVAWDSSPPDPDGVPARVQARWLSEAFYSLWRQGVSTITWYLIRDERPIPSYAATNQGGIFLASGIAKPSAAAFAFPFVADVRDRSGRATVWGKTPRSGAVIIERRSDRSWVRVTSVRVGSNRVFSRRITARRGVVLRARQGGIASRAYRAR